MIYGLLILSLLISGLFSGIEIAFVSASRLRIELNKEDGTKAERILAELNQNAPNFITSLLIGNNIMLILFSGYMAHILAVDFDILGESGFSILVQTVITTIVVLIFGEFFPKAFFRISPYGILTFFAFPLKVFYSIFKFPAYLFSGVSHRLIRLIMPQSYDENIEEFTSIDLEHYIKDIAAQHQNEDEEDDINSEIFEKALYLKEVKVRECMIPRTEIEAIESTTSVEELRQKFIDTKLSRILIYEESIDDILGYTHHIDLIKNPKSIKENIYEMLVVPEAMSARDLLTKFTKENKNIAYVVDEFGGTAGIVTLEDLIEEIFGEIQDEHDEDEYIEKELGENKFLFSGRLEIDYLNEKYDLKIPEGEYETLAGFVVETHENIPSENQKIVLGNFEILIVSAANNHIKMIELESLAIEDQ